MRLSVLSLAVLLVGCGRSAREPEWVTATSQDGTVRIDLPPSYRRDGARDSWATVAPDSAMRRVSVRRLSGAGLPSTGGVPAPVEPWENGCGPAARAADVGCMVERTRTDTQLAGRPFVIETGRHAESGFSRAPLFGLRALWVRAPGDTVRLEGVARDRAGLAELGRIARTLRPATRGAGERAPAEPAAAPRAP